MVAVRMYVSYLVPYLVLLAVNASYWLVYDVGGGECYITVMADWISR